MEGEVKKVDLEQKILEFISNHSKGIPNKELQKKFKTIKPEDLVDALNKLTAADKIQILTQGQQLLYKVKVQDQNRISKGEDMEERIIYEIIKNAGNKGIWIRELRNASNLNQVPVNKILKTLETKKRIKSVQSIAAAKKKVYMLYELEPDRSVTGGTWYSNQEFEAEYVEVLSQQCYKYLLKAKAVADKMEDVVSQRRASFKLTEEISDYINGLEISKIKLTHQDIEAILQTLIFDSKIEKCSGISSENTSYRAIKPLQGTCGLMRVPCGVCPVYKDCSENGVISPSKCVYLKDWLLEF